MKGVFTKYISEYRHDVADGVHLTSLLHPCERNKMYTLKQGREPDFTPEQLQRFNYGTFTERMAREALESAGWEILADNETHRTKFDGAEIVLTPDFIARSSDGVEYVIEAKSSEKCQFNRIASIDALLNSTFWIYRAWVLQVALYSRELGLPGLLWIIPVPTGPDDVMISVDPNDERISSALTEFLCSLKRANSGMGTRINDPSLCRRCPYFTECLPSVDVASDHTFMRVDEDEIEELARTVEDMRDAYRQYNNAHRKLGDILKNIGGEEIVLNVRDRYVIRAVQVDVIPKKQFIEQKPYSYYRYEIIPKEVHHGESSED